MSSAESSVVVVGGDALTFFSQNIHIFDSEHTYIIIMQLVSKNNNNNAIVVLSVYIYIYIIFFFFSGAKQQTKGGRKEGL